MLESPCYTLAMDSKKTRQDVGIAIESLIEAFETMADQYDVAYEALMTLRECVDTMARHKIKEIIDEALQ